MEEIKLERKRAINRVYMQRWREKNLELSRERVRLQYSNLSKDQKEVRLAYLREWRKNNKDRMRDYQRKYQVVYRQNNINAKIRHNLRNRLWGALNAQRTRKNTSLEELIGCSIPILKSYIERQFLKGMNWNAKIHIDHKKPLISFNLTDLEQQKKAFHYSNLQPLWARDNLVKGSKIYG